MFLTNVYILCLNKKCVQKVIVCILKPSVFCLMHRCKTVRLCVAKPELIIILDNLDAVRQGSSKHDKYLI